MICERIDIWKDSNCKQIYNDGFIPVMDTYVLSGNKKRGAVLVCPGGGYIGTSDREAEQVALKFNSAGFHAFVLYYSVVPRRHPQPLMDASRAMCIIRENAKRWNVDAEKIVICGFSAGGHLAASLGVHWDKEFLSGSCKMEGVNKPNALILCYAVISSGEFGNRGLFENLFGNDNDPQLMELMSLEKHISEKTPPAFLWHTYNDKSVNVENSLLFAKGLREYKIPFEMHIYSDGPHGLSLANKETQTEDIGADPHIESWIDLCTEWLELELNV